MHSPLCGSLVGELREGSANWEGFLACRDEDRTEDCAEYLLDRTEDCAEYLLDRTEDCAEYLLDRTEDCAEYLLDRTEDCAVYPKLRVRISS